MAYMYPKFPDLYDEAKAAAKAKAEADLAALVDSYKPKSDRDS